MVSRSLKRAELGAFGGLPGGAVGGALVDVLALIFPSMALSRALGLVLVGTAIGIIVACLEQIASECRLTVLTGSKEGCSYMISKDEPPSAATRPSISRFLAISPCSGSTREY